MRGSLFVDYVRMLRMRKDVDWSKHLFPQDISFLVQRIDPNGWYPMESFERMGLAILGEITDGNLEPVKMWGRASIDGLAMLHEHLVAHDDPRESLMRFQTVRRGFFDYPAVEINEISDEHANVHVAYGMSPLAEEAATQQTVGFFERLLEVCGARDPDVYLVSKSWSGDAQTVIALRWRL